MGKMKLNNPNTSQKSYWKIINNGDSTTNQLIDLLVDEIHQAFDGKKPLEVRAVFLDILDKAFDTINTYSGLVKKNLHN